MKGWPGTGPAPDVGVVRLRPADRARILARRQHRLLDPQHHSHRHRHHREAPSTLIATIVSMRCKGMTLGRMPLFVWLMLVVSSMVLFILPPLTAGQLMLLLDRYLGAHFFDTQAGGSAVLWQHFFWLFGHPEVYVLMLPGFACASEIIPVFSRKPMFGRAAMIGATVGIGMLSSGVWAHHMFTVGMTASFQYLLRGRVHGGRHARRKESGIFNWLRNDAMEEKIRFGKYARCCFCIWLPVPVFDRRTDRDHAGRCSV